MASARKPPTRQRRRGLGQLLPDPAHQGAAQGLGCHYPGLQHHNLEAAALAALLVSQGWGSIRSWLEEEPAQLTMVELVQAAARGSISGREAARRWQEQRAEERGKSRLEQQLTALFDAA